MKRILSVLLGLVILAGIVVIALYWRSAIAPIAPPPATSFSPQLVQQGAQLAGVGNCAACHTVKGGAAFAGGFAIDTPFGKVYSTNITPDAATGIGAWSQEAFKRAMREGVRRDGANLYPAFPYTHFAIVTEPDLTALYAFLMSQPAVSSPAKDNTVPFPLNVRALQSGWKLLFFDSKAAQAYATNPAKGVDWNRGRYLAEGLAHCAACHTPRNRFGAELKSAPYLGAAIDNWFAPALTAANTAPLPWTEAELFAYLRGGATALHGSAAGPMSEVVHDGLALSPDSDVHAIATYFADMNGSAAAGAAAAPATQAKLDAALAKSASVVGQYHDHGATLYLAACASCHSNSNGVPAALRPELSLNSAVSAADPANLVQVILHGVSTRDGMPGVMMPGFGRTMADADIAALAAYLRASRTTQAPWPDLQAKVAAIRKSSAQ